MKNYDIKYNSPDECVRYYSIQRFINNKYSYHIDIIDGINYYAENLHRLDGPAVECDNGTEYWWYKGKSAPVNSQKEFEQYLKLLAFA